MTRQEILDKYGITEKGLGGSTPVKHGDWSLYFLTTSGYVVCPECYHPCYTGFYNCGDDQCCYSHCPLASKCECMWSYDKDEAISIDDCGFDEIETGRWKVAWIRIKFSNGSVVRCRPIKEGYVRGLGFTEPGFMLV